MSARKGGCTARKDPTYCRSKGKGRPDRAFVDFDRDRVYYRVYLGEYGSDESYDWSDSRSADGLPFRPGTTVLLPLLLMES